MGWLGGQKAKHLNLGLHNISIKCDDNFKTTLKWCWKMNDCAHFLRFSLEENSFVSLIVVQMVGWKLEYLEVEGHKPT